MQLIRKHSSTSNILRIKLRNSSTGQGLTGLDESSSGLIISTICDNEASATAYAVASSKVETISSIGTYAAPTATKCRFKVVDATNHPGTYELQLADARFSVASAKVLRINISGATNLLDKEVLIQLDPLTMDTTQGAVTFSGLVSNTTTMAGAISGVALGLAQGAVTFSGLLSNTTTMAGAISVDAVKISGDSTAADNLESMLDGTGGVTLSLKKIYIVNADAVASGIEILTSDGDSNGIHINSGGYDINSDGNGGWFLSGLLDANISEVTSITGNVNGKVLGGGVGTITGTGVRAIDGSGNAIAPASATTAIQAKTDNLPASPASTTNITAGTITTVTNLTNAPTSGDLTATMKASVTTAATAATPTIAGYTGNTPQTGDAYAVVSNITSGNAALRTRGDAAWTTATSVTVSDKTGFKLASDGLDSVSTTAPSGVASNFREMLVQVWRRFFKKSTLSATQLKTYADDGTTLVTTQTVSDTGGTQTQGTSA